jgi:hypothetical protein
MMPAPTRDAIRAAELRVVRAKQRTRDHARRARLALTERLSRPSTWAVAGAAAVGGAWLFHRARSSRAPADEGGGHAAETSTAAVVAAFAARYAAKFLMRYLGEMWLAAGRNAMERSSTAAEPAPTGLQSSP